MLIYNQSFRFLLISGYKKTAFIDASQHNECGLSVFPFLKGNEKSPISIHRKRAALDKVIKVKEELLHHLGCSFPAFFVESYFTPFLLFVNRIE